MYLARTRWLFRRHLHGPAPPPKESVYSAVAEYPPLPSHPVDDYLTGKDEVKEKMKSLDSVEEKAYYLNYPKYYGWFSLLLNEKQVSYNSKHFVETITATDSSTGDLPSPKSLRALPSDVLQKSIGPLKAYIQDHFSSRVPPESVRSDEVESFEDFHKRSPEEKAKRDFIYGLDRLLSCIVRDTSFQTDYCPRLEAFWFKGGFLPDKRMILRRRGNHKARLKNKQLKGNLEDYDASINAPYDRPISYQGTPLLTKRTSSFVPGYLPIEECKREFNLEDEFIANPLSLCSAGHTYGRNIPCAWTGTSFPCIHLSFLSSVNAFERESTQSAINTQGFTPNDVALIKSVLYSFSACLSSSTYFGFTPFNNPTYPITTRTVVFDGMSMAISSYQLNRTELHHNQTEEEGRDLRNRIWFSPYRELYKINPENGVVDINEELLLDLLRLYLEETNEHMSDIEASPYLNPDFKFNYQIKTAYEREYFWKEYLKINRTDMSNLKRPQVEPWQKIHLIDNPQNMDIAGLRERPFFKMAELDFRGREHWDPEFRKLDYYEPNYLPAKFRPKRNPFKANKTSTRKVTIPVPK